MGKIFDAMEKFQAEHSSAVRENDHRPHFEPHETVHQPSFSKVGPMGRSHKKFDKNLVAYHDPFSHEAEQFKILRTTLTFPASGKPARTIMITSAIPGEGKSFVAANLAVSMALDINRHVLLIDGDIRSPRLHTIFGFGKELGLSEHLSKATPLSDLILKTMVEKLNLLPGGTPPHNPAELLSSEAMSRLLQEARERYEDRYIILDSPPPRMTAESAAMARQVDGVIVVVKADSTPKKLVEQLVNQLGKDKILGIVMNHFTMEGSLYYGYGKYGAYGRQ